MKRAAPCVVALALLLGCDQSKSTTAAPSRVEAIRARSSDDSAASFCDVAPARAAAPTFSFPKLEGPAPLDVKGPRWINLWATWCPPCIEELPRLKQLVAELKSAGSAVSLQLVSLDSTAGALDAFAKNHVEAAGSPRLSDPMALEAWLTSIGLDKGATLPVHIFVGGDGKVLCARTGAIRDSDLPAIKKLLASAP
ncbi:MAG: Thioredoxin [Myxococcaceae bacterium]|nr:Thioredoxin [Myxococcaceae bacterium]